MFSEVPPPWHRGRDCFGIHGYEGHYMCHEAPARLHFSLPPHTRLPCSIPLLPSRPMTTLPFSYSFYFSLHLSLVTNFLSTPRFSISLPTFFLIIYFLNFSPFLFFLFFSFIFITHNIIYLPLLHSPLCILYLYNIFFFEWLFLPLLRFIFFFTFFSLQKPFFPSLRFPFITSSFYLSGSLLSRHSLPSVASPPSATWRYLHYQFPIFQPLKTFHGFKAGRREGGSFALSV